MDDIIGGCCWGFVLPDPRNLLWVLFLTAFVLLAVFGPFDRTWINILVAASLAIGLRLTVHIVRLRLSKRNEDRAQQ